MTAAPAAGGPFAALVALGTPTTAFGTTHLDLAPADWAAALGAARRVGLDFFDWLSGTDDGSGGVLVVCSLWSRPARAGLLLRTALPAGGAELPTATGHWPGADWHERETAEMFGVVFTGHPDPRPLLLPAGFAGHPLRKDFVLAARAVRPWPGSVDPAGDRASGRRAAPPGPPPPAGWGER